jgi:Mce-associated membrane protein
LTDLSTGKTRATGARLALVVVPLVLLVLALVVSGVLLYRHAHPTEDALSIGGGGQPIPSDAEQHKVVAVAEQFCLRMDGVDGSDVDGYKKRVAELLTTKQKAKFTGEFAEFEKVGVDKALKGTGTVLASGVSDIDSDSATVLVAHDSTVKATSGTTERHYRWTVALRKVHGRWLVDDFTPVS